MMRAWKKILALFLAISLTTSGLGVCADSGDILDFVAAFSKTKIVIKSLSKTTAAPFEIIKINGKGFSPVSDMLVTFANGPYVVKVPPAFGSASTLEVPVPVFFNTTSAALGPGVVSITVTSKSRQTVSNSMSSFSITDLPTSADPPGTVTLAFLNDMQTLAGYAQSQLGLLQQASSGAVNTSAQVASLITESSTLGELKTAIVALMNNQPLTGSSIVKVSKPSLAVADRLILGYLTQLSNVAGPPKAPEFALTEEALPRSRPVPPVAIKQSQDLVNKTGTTMGTGQAKPGEALVSADALTIPSLKQCYENLVTYVKDPNFDQKLLEFMKRNEGVVATAGGVVGALVILGVVVEGSPIAVLIGGGALVYAGGIAFANICDYMSCYLGLPSGVTKAQGFFPLAKQLFDTGLAVATYNLPGSSVPKQLADLYGQVSANSGIKSQLLEDVSKNAPIIYPNLMMVQITLSPPIIDAVIDCVLDPPPGTGQFTLWSGTISVTTLDYVSWFVKIPILPESGSSVTVTPSSGTGSKVVNVVIKYPSKICWCPCALSWASGTIAEFQAITTGAATGGALLSVSVDNSSCYCY